MYKYVLFDLDGTLTDPGIGITNGVMYALKKFGIEVSDRTELYKFIGPPLLESFMKYYGLSEEDSRQAIVYYREQYNTTGLFENEVYEGIPKLLSELKEAGKMILLATSKPQESATRILKHFGLYEYFDFVGGASMDGSRTKKADVISYVLDSCGITDLEAAIMVGDREHDVLGAKQVGLKTIGVLFGYGNYEELEQAGALYIAEKVEDISGYILG